MNYLNLDSNQFALNSCISISNFNILSDLIIFSSAKQGLVFFQLKHFLISDSLAKLKEEHGITWSKCYIFP